LEQFESTIDLSFRNGVPGREGLVLDDMIEEIWSDEQSRFDERMGRSSEEIVGDSVLASEARKQAMAEGLFGPEGKWNDLLSGQGPATPGYNLAASQGLSSVLGKVPGLQPQVTGELFDNPNLYDVFIDDFELVF
jgi:hypothetical protein